MMIVRHGVLVCALNVLMRIMPVDQYFKARYREALQQHKVTKNDGLTVGVPVSMSLI
jgi:hypothetical protein